MVTSTSIGYIFDILVPVLISTFDHLSAYEFGQDLLVDEIQVSCFKIIECLYVLGTNVALTKSKRFLRQEITQHRANIGVCLAAISSTFPVAFLEPSLHKYNPHSVIGSGFAKKSLEAQGKINLTSSSECLLYCNSLYRGRGENGTQYSVVRQFGSRDSAICGRRQDICGWTSSDRGLDPISLLLSNELVASRPRQWESEARRLFHNGHVSPVELGVQDHFEFDQETRRRSRRHVDVQHCHTRQSDYHPIIGRSTTRACLAVSQEMSWASGTNVPQGGSLQRIPESCYGWCISSGRRAPRAMGCDRSRFVRLSASAHQVRWHTTISLDQEQKRILRSALQHHWRNVQHLHGFRGKYLVCVTIDKTTISKWWLLNLQYFKREEQNFLTANEIDPMALIMPSGSGRTRNVAAEQAQPNKAGGAQVSKVIS